MDSTFVGYKDKFDIQAAIISVSSTLVSELLAWNRLVKFWLFHKRMEGLERTVALYGIENGEEMKWFFIFLSIRF